MQALTITGDTALVSGELNAGLFERWTAFIDASPKTVETYSKNIRRFLAYLQSNGITQPQRDNILSYRDYLKAHYRPTTVQGYLAAVKLFFQWTEQEGLYPNIAQRIKGAKLDTEHKRDYLTTKQVGRMLDAVERDSITGLRDYALLSLMVTTGLREISVASANIGDIRAAGDATALY